MRNLTPAHLRCTTENCPSVHEFEDGRLLIVGKRAPIYFEGAAGPSQECVDLCADIAPDEHAIIIDKALLATIRDEVREECARIADDPEGDIVHDWGEHRNMVASQETGKAIAVAIRALKETPHE